MLTLISLEKEHTAQKMKFSMKDFFIKCDQIRSFLRIWSHLLKKFLIESFIFCARHFFLRLLPFGCFLQENTCVGVSF